MNKLVICTVRDRAANTFGTPFFAVSVGTAIRSFNDAVNNTTDPANTMAHHPEDFDLYQLGTYSDAHATFDLLAHPAQIAIGKDVVTKPLQLSSVAKAVSG